MTVSGTVARRLVAEAFSGGWNHKLMPKAVAGLRSHLPLMTRGGPEVACDLLLGAGGMAIDAESRTLASHACDADHGCDLADVLSRRLFHIAAEELWSV